MLWRREIQGFRCSSMQEVYKDIEELSDLAAATRTQAQEIKASIPRHCLAYSNMVNSSHISISPYSSLIILTCMPYRMKYMKNLKILQDTDFTEQATGMLVSKAVEFWRKWQRKIEILSELILEMGVQSRPLGIKNQSIHPWDHAARKNLITETCSGDISAFSAIIHYLTDKGYTDKEIINILK